MAHVTHTPLPSLLRPRSPTPPAHPAHPTPKLHPSRRRRRGTTTVRHGSAPRGRARRGRTAGARGPATPRGAGAQASNGCSRLLRLLPCSASAIGAGCGRPAGQLASRPPRSSAQGQGAAYSTIWQRANTRKMGAPPALKTTRLQPALKVKVQLCKHPRLGKEP